MVPRIAHNRVARKAVHHNFPLSALNDINIVMADNAHGFQLIDNILHILFIHIRQIDKGLVKRHLPG